MHRQERENKAVRAATKARLRVPRKVYWQYLSPDPQHATFCSFLLATGAKCLNWPATVRANVILHTKNLAQDLAYITPSKCWRPLLSTESSVKSSISTTPPDSVNPMHTEQEASAPLKETTQLSHVWLCAVPACGPSGKAGTPSARIIDTFSFVGKGILKFFQLSGFLQ